MLEAKHVPTPVATTTELYAFDGESFSNHTLVRTINGAPQYLFITSWQYLARLANLRWMQHEATWFGFMLNEFRSTRILKKT